MHVYSKPAHASVFAVALLMTNQPGIFSVYLAICYSESASSMFDGDAEHKGGLGSKRFEPHVMKRRRAESPGRNLSANH